MPYRNAENMISLVNAAMRKILTKQGRLTTVNVEEGRRSICEDTPWLEDNNMSSKPVIFNKSLLTQGTLRRHFMLYMLTLP